MRSKLTNAVAVASMGLTLVACGHDKDKNSGAAAPSAPVTSAKPPASQVDAAGMVLAPSDVDQLLGITGSKSKYAINVFEEDAQKYSPGKWKFPDECAYALGAAERQVYSGAGDVKIVGDDIAAFVNNDHDVEVGQAIVIFPTAKAAQDFFTKSTTTWKVCADRQFTTPAVAVENPKIDWKVGPVANSSGVLTTSLAMKTASASDGGPSVLVNTGRALTVRDNLVIDVDVTITGKDPGDSAVKVANAIAGREPQH